VEDFNRRNQIIEKFPFQTCTGTDTCTCSYTHMYTYLCKIGFDFERVRVRALVDFNPLSAPYSRKYSMKYIKYGRSRSILVVLPKA